MKSIKRYEKEENFKKLNKEEKTLVHMIYWSKQKTNQLIDNDIVVVDDVVWDYVEFGKALKKFDVKKIIFSSTWSSAIELLMYLLKIGYVVEGPIVYHKEKYFSRTEIKEGLKLVRSE